MKLLWQNRFEGFDLVRTSPLYYQATVEKTKDAIMCNFCGVDVGVKSVSFDVINGQLLAHSMYAKNNKSAALGQYMQTQLNQQLGSTGNRKCKQGSSLYLLENITCPGILIECGFLTNPEEESKLRSANYQKRLCGVITTAVSRYLVLDQNGTG